MEIIEFEYDLGCINSCFHCDNYFEEGERIGIDDDKERYCLTCYNQWVNPISYIKCSNCGEDILPLVYLPSITSLLCYKCFGKEKEKTK